MMNLTGKDKAAVMMLILGSDVSSEVFKYLNDQERSEITKAIADLPKVSPQQKDQVLQEFHKIIAAQEFISKGGVEYAKEILKKAFGEERAQKMVENLLMGGEKKPFDFVKDADPAQLATFLQNEHPQTIALVLSYLEPYVASGVLESLPEDVRADVTKRIATMQYASPEAIKEIEKALKEKIGVIITTAGVKQMGGIQAVVNILNESNRNVERSILEAITDKDPELAEEIKKRLFTFEDILKLDDRSCQRVLREVDIRELAIALKGASEIVQEKIFKNMPKRAVAMLQEEMEYLGAVSETDIEENQQKIVNIIRQLEDSGEIVIQRGKRKR